ncbi:MAG: UDP-3-O-acyl-N-acetylglucosamine deacetylase [Candidatus Margulisbacteria bacterium]|nr:UDP-3-O-acyl-N-acetylglucosamine deacetylase [Candidatus Margulisiibacteriota bacterium]
MQQTITRPISCSGIGIHSGQPVNLTFYPAPANHGIKFIRQDLKNDNRLKITPGVFSGENNMTCLLKDSQVFLKTVEHLMAAIYGLEIDNLIIEVSNEEMPALDGSALPYVDLLKEAKLKQQKGEKQVALNIKDIVFEQGKEGSFLIALPAHAFKLSVAVDYPDLKPVGIQIFSSKIEKGIFEKKIAPARTLGKMKDLESYWEKGLAKGVNLNNAIGITDAGYSCPLRFIDEIVRHKVMDLVGDLGGLRKRIKAHIIGYKTNHRLNINFMKKLSGL